jgi:hypothetical protein
MNKNLQIFILDLRLLKICQEGCRLLAILSGLNKKTVFYDSIYLQFLVDSITSFVFCDSIYWQFLVESIKKIVFCDSI